MITLSVLQEIIQDSVLKTTTLKRVGITGSFSRGDFTDRRDIDLVFDIEGSFMDDATLASGISIKSIIGDQFGHDVDIIDYAMILTRIEQYGNPLALSGYKQMLKDLKWIWWCNA